MRKLLTQDSDGSAESLEKRQGAGSPNRQAIDEIMEGVTERYHPGNCPYFRQFGPLQTGT